MNAANRTRWVLAVLVLGQAILLYLTASSWASHGTLYGCSVLCGTAQHALRLLAALFGVAMFVLPILIGALSRTWQNALALAAAPWCAAVIGHAGSLLTPTINVAANPGPYGGLFGTPFWLNPQHITTLILSFVLFLGLGGLGWLARQVPVSW